MYVYPQYETDLGGANELAHINKVRGISHYTVHFMYMIMRENVSDNQQILNSIHCTYSCLITWMNLLFCSLKNLPVDCSVAIFVCTIEGEGCLTGAAIVAIVAPPDVIRQN